MESLPKPAVDSNESTLGDQAQSQDQAQKMNNYQNQQQTQQTKLLDQFSANNTASKTTNSTQIKASVVLFKPFDPPINYSQSTTAPSSATNNNSYSTNINERPQTQSFTPLSRDNSTLYSQLSKFNNNNNNEIMVSV